MPPLAESSLAPETATGILEDAGNLAEDKLSALENFLASLNLSEDSLASLGDGALALAASFLAVLGFDDLFPGPGAPDLPAGNPARAGLTNPSSIQQVRVTFGDSEKVCPAAPADEATVTSTEDLNAVFPPSKEIDVDVVYQTPSVEEAIEKAGAKTAVEHEIDEVYVPDTTDYFIESWGPECEATLGPHDFASSVIVGSMSEPSPLGPSDLTLRVTIECKNCHLSVRTDYPWQIPTIH